MGALTLPPGLRNLLPPLLLKSPFPFTRFLPWKVEFLALVVPLPVVSTAVRLDTTVLLRMERVPLPVTLMAVLPPRMKLLLMCSVQLPVTFTAIPAVEISTPDRTLSVWPVQRYGLRGLWFCAAAGMAHSSVAVNTGVIQIIWRARITDVLLCLVVVNVTLPEGGIFKPVFKIVQHNPMPFGPGAAA